MPVLERKRRGAAVGPAMGSSRLRRRPLRHRLGQCLRVSLAFLFSQVGLLAVVAAYSAAGAVLFAWLEADQELEPRRKILRLRIDCLRQLRNLSHAGIPLTNAIKCSF